MPNYQYDGLRTRERQGDNTRERQHAAAAAAAAGAIDRVEACAAHVAELEHAPVLGQEDVLRLDVSVQDLAVVHVLHREAELPGWGQGEGEG